MAYVLPQLDEEEEQLQQEQSATMPRLGGAAPSIGGASGGGSVPQQQTPKAQNAQSKGSGFTNLQNWLDAGQGRHQNIASTGQNLLGQEKTAFGAAAKPLQDASFTAETLGGDIVNNAISGDAGAKTKIKGMLSQDYSGPMSVDYDASSRKNLWDVGSLSDAKTAGSVLAKPAIDAGQYGAGMRRLDSVLFGADAASRGAMDAQGKGLTDFTKQVGSDTKQLEDKALGFKDEAAKAREGTRTELTNRHKELSDRLDSRVADAQAKEAKDRELLQQGLVYNPKTRRYERLAPGQMAGQTTGTTADRRNIMSESEKTGFDSLDELIGSGKVDRTGNYARPTTEVIKDPNYVAPLPSRGGHDPRLGTVMESLKRTNPEHFETLKKAYTEYGPQNDGVTDQAVAFSEFWDRFQREHPEVPIMTGEEADASEALQGSAVDAWKKDHPGLSVNPYYTAEDKTKYEQNERKKQRDGA